MIASKGKLSMKKILSCIILSLTLLILAACGGGGGGGGGSNGPSTVTLKINLAGTLPASTAISGADFTVTLPANVTPVLTNGVVATNVVANSATFAGSTLSPQVTYAAATASNPGTLRVILSSSDLVGVAQVGEAATITLQLANGVAPTTANFGLSAISVFDVSLYNHISGMNASIASVTLQ